MLKIEITGTNFADCKAQAEAIFLFNEVSVEEKPRAGISAVQAVEPPEQALASPIAKATKKAKPSTKKETIKAVETVEVETEEAEETSEHDIADVKEEVADEKEYTEVDLRSAAGGVLSHFSGKGQDGIAPLQGLLKQFGVMKAVEVQAGERAKFIAACKKACV